MTDAAGDGALRKRSVLIAGHKTSVSLEGAFWEELRAIAAEREISLSRLIEEIDTTRGGNLSSAIRLFVLDRLREKMRVPAGGDLGIVTMRPFLPAKDYAKSLKFYEALGFCATPLGNKLAHLQLGAHAFLLQDFYVKEFAENLMMHLLVEKLDDWWPRIEGLKLETAFDVPAPRPPKLENWGLRVAYIFDPSGVLWHVAEEMPAAT